MAKNKPTPELAAAIKATEEKYGDLPKGLLEELASIESEGGRNLVNPKSSARGPFQFMEYTGPEFGLMTEADRMDIAKSTDAAARLTIRNKQTLEKKLGRTVSGGELYLAHQQGADGAAKLLKNPNALARDVVGGKDPASKIRLNGGDPDKVTAGAFATKWTSKIDGVSTAPTAPTAPTAGKPPGKKPEPRATGSLGVLPGGVQPLPSLSKPTDFLTYDPNNLTELNRRVTNTGAMARAGANAPSLADQMMTDIPVAKGSLATNLGKLGTVANTPASASAEQEAPVPRKSTAILAGLNTVDKVMRTQAVIDSTIESDISEYEYGVSGLGGAFSAGIDAGMAGINKDREYFGLILDTLTGNKEGVWSHEKNAEMAEAAAAFATSGLPSFEEFMKAPTLDGFIMQAANVTGQVAPSALESIASALVGGGAGMLGKLGFSVASKTVVKELVTDILKKKVAKQALDQNEDNIMKTLWAAGKKGAMAGAFGQEFVMGAGESISEFKQVDKDINMEEALGALAMGVPQAAVGVGGEMFLVKAFGEAALKKSSRIAGDNVFKRFASDMGALMGKAGLSEGTTEAIQEGLFIAQRKAIDPTYTDEEAQLRMAQSIFSGIVGGGLFAGGAAAPTAAISALNRTTLPDPNAPAPAAGTAAGTPPPGGGTPPPAGTPPKKSIMDTLKGVMGRATSYIEDASEARVKAEAKQNVEGVDDSVLTGNTAPEGTVVLAAQYKEMMDPASPRKHVWIAENDFDTTLDTLQQERLKREGYFTEEQTDPANAGTTLEYGWVPGKGVMVGVLPKGAVAGSLTPVKTLVAMTKEPERTNLNNRRKAKSKAERLDSMIGAMLGMADTGGVKGDTVVRVKNKQGVPIAEQTTDAAGVPAAVEAMQAQAPEAEVEVVPLAQSLTERKQRVDSEQTADDFFKRFAEEATPAATPVVTPAEKKGLNEALKALPEEDIQKQIEEEEAALKAATDPMSDDPKVIKNLADDYGFGDYTDPDFEVYADTPADGPVRLMSDAEIAKANESLAEGLALELKKKRPNDQAIFSIRHAIRALEHEGAKRTAKAPQEKSETRSMVIDPKNKKQIAGATGKTSSLIDSVYRAMGATDDPNGQWNEPDNAKVVSLIDGAVADDTVSEAEMKTAFKEVHDDWRTDMTGWDKAKIAAAWKDWGGFQTTETRDMKIDPKNKNPGKTAGYTAPSAVSRVGADGKVRKIPVESKGGKVQGEATTATPYPVVREEGDSTESFQKMEPTGAPDSRGEVDIDPEDQNREPTLQDKIELRFGREADNAEVVSKEFAKKEFPIEISERGPTALKAIKELFKLIIQDISIASLKEQLPYMMDSMLINLLKLVKQDQESIFTIEDAGGVKLLSV